MTPKQRHREAVLTRSGGACELQALVPGHVCGGRIEAMHVIPCQILRIEQSKFRLQARRGWSAWAEAHPLLKVTLDELISDPRNGIAACSAGHQAHDQHRQRIPREALPTHVSAFVRDYFVTHMLDREFPLSRDEAA